MFNNVNKLLMMSLKKNELIDISKGIDEKKMDLLRFCQKLTL